MIDRQRCCEAVAAFASSSARPLLVSSPRLHCVDLLVTCGEQVLYALEYANIAPEVEAALPPSDYARAVASIPSREVWPEGPACDSWQRGKEESADMHSLGGLEWERHTGEWDVVWIGQEDAAFTNAMLELNNHSVRVLLAAGSHFR